MIEDKFLELNNVRMHFIERPGSGLPLLLLHGLTDSLASYLPLISGLPECWHVYAIDFRGHGLSMHVPGKYRICDYAKDIQSFIRNNFNETVVVAGHSLGGLVSIWLGANAGEMVRGLFLEDPPIYKGLMPAFSDTIIFQDFVALRNGLKKHVEMDASVDDLTKWLARWVAPSFSGKAKPMMDSFDERLIRSWAIQLYQMDQEALAVTIEGMLFGGFDPDVTLQKIKCPTHLIIGDYHLGGLMDKDDIERVGLKLPHCTFTLLGGIGHMIHQLRPRDYLVNLEKFAGALL